MPTVNWRYGSLKPDCKGIHHEQKNRICRNGNNGLPMVVNLAKAGFEVVGYDAFKGVYEKASAAGIPWSKL